MDPDDPGKDPRFRKLVDAILFSRRFVSSYNLVLLAVVGVFTIRHWVHEAVLRRRRSQSRRSDCAGASDKLTTTGGRPEEAEAWSSSSSTVEGSATPPDAKKRSSRGETSPLLGSRVAGRTGAGWLWRPYYSVAAALQYQPRPIPIVNKILPTNAVSLLVLGWVALVGFYSLYRMPISLLYLFVFADRCGIVFITNLPLLYLLAAKNQPLQFLTGYSYESLNIFHRRVGEVVCFEAFLHCAGMFAVWYGLLRHLGLTLVKFLFNRVVLLGLGAFIAYEGIYFTSLGSFRQRWYEFFLAIHIILQIAGLVFLWFHHYTSRPYVGVSLAIFLIDRLAFRLWLKSSTHPATITILEDDETLLLSANWELTKPTTLAPTNMSHGWQPNQHIFISVPSLSRKHALQSHPFTIFSAAPSITTTTTTTANTTRTHFTLLIRAQSPHGFTHSLLAHARLTPTLPIRLDGPYGSPHALALLTTSHTAILIAGGSGIAVAYPLLHALLHPRQPTDPEAATSTLQLISHRSVKLLWITHAPAHRLWIPEDKLKQLEDWGLDVLITPPTALAGRPDAGAITTEWVGERATGRVGVVVSGPDGLVRDVRNACARAVWRGGDVGLQVEKFGW